MREEETYSLVLEHFGLEEFKTSDLNALVKAGNLSLTLHRMVKSGYLDRVSRGVFRAVHPIILALEQGGCRWRSRIVQREYLPMLEFLTARIVDRFWSSLVSLAVFGSVARGEAKPESDIDLLIVVRGLPHEYSKRLLLLREATRGVEGIRLKLWRAKGIYPLIDPVLLTPEEAELEQPFYLDMVRGSVIVFDRNGFMRGRLERLSSRLAELGARRVELPDGRWYWELKRVGRW